MRLIKKINNNVALGVDSQGRNVVVFGKGVGFHRMPHEVTSSDNVERVFRDVIRSAADALVSIDPDVLRASSDIVDLARMELEGKLNPNLPFTLADHVQFAIERQREGIDIQNPLAGEVSVVYPKELAVGRTAVAMVNHRVKDANLPEAEAANIALHLVNGEMGATGDSSDMGLVVRSTTIIRNAAEIIEEDAGVRLDRESFAFNRFAAHLRYLVARLMQDKEEHTTNSSLFEQAADDFPEVYSCVKKIDDYLEREYGWSCSNEELLYLMMHVNRILTSAVRADEGTN